MATTTGTIMSPSKSSERPDELKSRHHQHHKSHDKKDEKERKHRKDKYQTNMDGV